MKLIKDRKFAVTIVVLVSILASLLGMRMTLTKKQTKLEQHYQNGFDASGKGIGVYLADMDRCAANLVKLSEYYPELSSQTEQLRLAREQYAVAKTGSARYAVYQNLSSASELLYEAMGQVNITAVDRQMLEKYYTSGVADLAKKTRNVAAAYNESVEEYNRLLSRFPASVLHSLLGISKTEKFA